MKCGSFIAVTIAAGLLVGWFGPGTMSSEGPNSTDLGTVSGPSTSAQQENWLAGEVVLQRESDGHFYADAGIDGSTARMLVDTGASMVALTGEDADALGVNWDPDDIRPVARGAGGTVYGTTVTIDHMQLGSLEARNVSAIVVPEGLGISLLGQTFLGKLGHVEIDQDRMMLGG